MENQVQNTMENDIKLLYILVTWPSQKSSGPSSKTCDLPKIKNVRMLLDIANYMRACQRGSTTACGKRLGHESYLPPRASRYVISPLCGLGLGLKQICSFHMNNRMNLGIWGRA